MSGAHHGLYAIFRPQFVHCRGKMQGNDRQRAAQLRGDFGGGQAVGGPFQALALAFGQTDMRVGA